MTIYTSDNKSNAEQMRQLLRLNSECVRLHWSRSITNVPDNVYDALDTIEAFVESYVKERCELFNELSENEEDAVIAFIRSTSDLNVSLGTGVIMAGSEADNAKALIGSNDEVSKVIAALETGKNVILF